MKRKKVVIVAGVVLSSVLLCNSFNAFGIGNNLDITIGGIPKRPIPISTTSEVSESYVNSILEAANLWNSIGLGEQYQYTGIVDTTEKDVSCDGRNVISMADMPSFQIARTIAWVPSGGQSMKEVDIMINQNTNFDLSNNGYDFLSVALHELGHGLGLEHGYEYDDIMHLTIKPGQQRRKISVGNYLRVEELQDMQAYNDNLMMAYVSDITEYLSLEQLKQQSPLIIKGVAVREKSVQWRDNLITTDLEIKVDEVLKGDYNQSTLTLTILGGTIGDTMMIVEDQPNGYIGIEAVLCLMPTDTEGRYVLYGNFLGSFIEYVDENLYSNAYYTPYLNDFR